MPPAQEAEVHGTHWRWMGVSGKMVGTEEFCVWERQKPSSLGGVKAGPMGRQPWATSERALRPLGCGLRPRVSLPLPQHSPAGLALLLARGQELQSACLSALSALSAHKPNSDTSNRAWWTCWRGAKETDWQAGSWAGGQPDSQAASP